MDQQALIAEGEAIAKPCFLLHDEPHGEVVGYWGGTRSDLPNSFASRAIRFKSRRHIVSISEQLLQTLGVDQLGAVGLFEWEAAEGELSLRVERDLETTFDSFTCDGDPLYAAAATSFPPFEALCLHGSERIAQWLETQGLRRHEYWKVPREDYEEYQAEYDRRSPFLNGGADVIVGGWHMLWPEDDFYVPAEMTYILLTLRDAEPWYSVWHSPATHACFAREHIT